MHRLVAVIILSWVAFAQNPQGPEIVRAARSPYDLARYINSHDNIDWEPLWHSLGVEAQLGLPCSMDCSAEIIAIEDPEQAVLVVQASLPYDVYLRFEKAPVGEWRVTGKYYAKVWDGTAHHHEIVRAGNTRFLLESTHGVHGSDIDEEMEVWFDLSRPGFQPVFSYGLRGGEYALGFGISGEIEAHAHANSPREIELRLNVNLSCSSESLDLGRFEFTGVYTRAVGGDFSLQEAHTGRPSSQIPNQEFNDFSRIGRASQEEEIQYALPRLKEIAAGSDGNAKMWLNHILDRTGDTPEKRTLLELLAKP